MTDKVLTLLDYETRNLGMPSYDLSSSFMSNPDKELLTCALTEKTAESNKLFVQARVVQEQFTTGSIVESAGFSFVETTLEPYTVLGKNPVLKCFEKNPESFISRRFAPSSIGFMSMDLKDLAACESVKRIAGESFVKDRFHSDLRCPGNLADRRFVFWVEDLLNGNTLFKLLLNCGEIIGFMARKGQHLILAGFSRKYSTSGLGDYFWLSVLSEMACEGLIQANTRISTNNVPILNLYARLGFKFKDPVAIFHFWHYPHQISNFHHASNALKGSTK